MSQSKEQHDEGRIVTTGWIDNALIQVVSGLPNYEGWFFTHDGDGKGVDFTVTVHRVTPEEKEAEYKSNFNLRRG